MIPKKGTHVGDIPTFPSMRHILFLAACDANHSRIYVYTRYDESCVVSRNGWFCLGTTVQRYARSPKASLALHQEVDRLGLSPLPVEHSYSYEWSDHEGENVSRHTSDARICT